MKEVIINASEAVARQRIFTLALYIGIIIPVKGQGFCQGARWDLLKVSKVGRDLLEPENKHAVPLPCFTCSGWRPSMPPDLPCFTFSQLVRFLLQ